MPKFRPTPAMLEFLDAALDPDVSNKIRSIARAAGVHESSWRLWRKDPRFRAWWNDCWHASTFTISWLLDKIGLARAQGKDPEAFLYWRRMQQKLGGLDTVLELPLEVVIRAPRPDRRGQLPRKKPTR